MSQFQEAIVLYPEFGNAKNKGKITFYEVLSTAKGIKLLLNGRVDVYVNGGIVVLNTAREMRVNEKILELPKPIHDPKPAYLIFSKKIINAYIQNAN